VDRRRFLAAGSAFAAAGALRPRVSEPAATNTRSDDALEAALERLAPTGPEFAGGLANHGPMAAEALVKMDRPEAVEPWVEAYRRRLNPLPSPREPIRSAEWADALGKADRLGDWIAFFQRQLEEDPWAEVLAVWAERLAPGLVAAATHGIIRTGHAVRGLARKDTRVRRHELAEGLAYWAGRYERLPERATHPGTRRPSEALAEVPLVPSERQVHRGFITDRLAPLSRFPPFEGVADLVDASGDLSAVLSDHAATFARVYLEQVADTGQVITFIHCVTGPSAVRLLLPHLPRPTQKALVRYAWQAAAGMYSAFARTAAPVPSRPPLSPDELVDRAVRNGDEHAIKFTEACLREHALLPRPVFLEAARDATERLGR